MLLSLIFLIVLVAAIVGFVFRHEVSLGGHCHLPVLQSEFDAAFTPVQSQMSPRDIWERCCLGAVLSLAKLGLNQHKEQLGPCKDPEGPAWVEGQSSTTHCPSIRAGRVALHCNFWLWSIFCNNFSN